MSGKNVRFLGVYEKWDDGLKQVNKFNATTTKDIRVRARARRNLCT
jgi:hypothetical protein